MEIKDRITLEINHSMMYVRADYLAYLGYSDEESGKDPLKIVVEAHILPNGKRVIALMRPDSEPKPAEPTVQEEVKC